MAVVEQVMASHWRWGSSDCTTAACDVFLLLHGIDPMAPLRGKYASSHGATLLIGRGGGMLALASRLARQAGLSEGVKAPGEIGVSTVGYCAGRLERAAVICVSPGAWAAKTPDGFAILPHVERSWRA